MTVFCLKVGSLDTNCYILPNNNKALVIDPGADVDKIIDFVNEKSLIVDSILLTHGHYDHVGGVKQLQTLTGAQIYASEKDTMLANSYKNLAFAFGANVQKFDGVNYLTEGNYNICGFDIKVIETPGHTSGGLTYIIEDNMFVGDTIFASSYGRTDFPTGSFDELKKSIIDKLFVLDKNYTVYTGHGESTTLDFERKNNPINFDD